MSSQSPAALDAESGSARVAKILKAHLTDQQAAEAIGFSIRTIKRWRAEGRLGYTRLGGKTPLTSPEDLEAMLHAAKRRPSRRGR
jgi:excisionase family DNA binding protein